MLTLRGALALALAASAVGGAALAQEPPEYIATRPLATRGELDSLAQRLASNDQGNLLGRVRARLNDGDFRPGDRIMLFVQGESTLTDTFTVDGNQALQLPPPTTGALSLRGVLRSELEPKVETFLARFVRNPVVRASPTVRFSVQGEVRNAGFYGVPADAVVTDVLMAAGGTMADADMSKFVIQRGRDVLYQGDALQALLSSRTTVDDAGLRDGDTFVIPKSRQGSWGDNLRFAYVLVSLTAGVYGLSKVIHH